MRTLATAVMLLLVLVAVTACSPQAPEAEAPEMAETESPQTLEGPTPGYNTEIPESILTPHDLETRIGTFRYFDGIPTPETADAIYNNLDYIRGVETFLNGLPAASLEAFRRGQVELGLKNSNQVLIFDELMDSNSLFLTGQYRHRLRQCLSRSEKGRPNRHRGSRWERPRNNQRCVLPIRSRHRPSWSRQGQWR